MKLPIYPCKGYSITVPVGQTNLSPKIGMVDGDHLVAFCPMGSRLRITSTAEFSGYDKGRSTEDFRAMFNVGRDLFPGGGYSNSEYRAGLRPMIPATVPIFGFARYRNLMLDIGHGHIVRTMACGSAKVVSDLIAERDPGIDPDGMLYSRIGSVDEEISVFLTGPWLHPLRVDSQHRLRRHDSKCRYFSLRRNTPAMSRMERWHANFRRMSCGSQTTSGLFRRR